jgi:hypothetical protein
VLCRWTEQLQLQLQLPKSITADVPFQKEQALPALPPRIISTGFILLLLIFPAQTVAAAAAAEKRAS